MNCAELWNSWWNLNVVTMLFIFRLVFFAEFWLKFWGRSGAKVGIPIGKKPGKPPRQSSIQPRIGAPSKFTFFCFAFSFTSLLFPRHLVCAKNNNNNNGPSKVGVADYPRSRTGRRSRCSGSSWTSGCATRSPSRACQRATATSRSAISTNFGLTLS